MKKFFLYFIVLFSCSNAENHNSKLDANKMKKINTIIKQIDKDSINVSNCLVDVNNEKVEIGSLSYNDLLDKKNGEMILINLSHQEDCWLKLAKILAEQIEKNDDTSAIEILHNMIQVKNVEPFTDLCLKLFVEKNELMVRYMAQDIDDTLLESNIVDGVGFNCFNREYIGSGEGYPEYEGKILLMNHLSFSDENLFIKSHSGEYNGFNIEMFIKTKLNDSQYTAREKIILKRILSGIEFARFGSNKIKDAVQMATVNDSDGKTNLRDGISKDSKILSTLLNGTEVIIIDDHEKWVYIVVKDDREVKGFIYKKNIKF